LVVFEQNKDYVNKVIEEQLDFMPYNMEYRRFSDLPEEKRNSGACKTGDSLTKYRARFHAHFLRFLAKPDEDVSISYACSYYLII